MKSVVLTINGESLTVNVDEGQLTKEQQAELKSAGIEATHAIRFSGGSVRFLTTDALNKLVKKSEVASAVASGISFS